LADSDNVAAMLPWKKLDAAREPSGGELALWNRGDEFTIRIDGEDLMGSLAYHSEEVLAQRGCEGLERVRGARVLVGGLGMGFTLKAALDALADDAEVDVAELVPAVVAWNRGPIAHLAGHPLDDSRVRVLEADVSQILGDARAWYDAILLDVDNGPDSLTTPSNGSLYSPEGIARSARALRRGGALAVWSVNDDLGFAERLERGGFRTRTELVPERPGGGTRHTLWVARRGED
jgi:spermidine synthase